MGVSSQCFCSGLRVVTRGFLLTYLSLPALGRIESRAVLANPVVFQCLPMVITNVRKYEILNPMLAGFLPPSLLPFLPPFLSKPSTLLNPNLEIFQKLGLFKLDPLKDPFPLLSPTVTVPTSQCTQRQWISKCTEEEKNTCPVLSYDPWLFWAHDLNQTMMVILCFELGVNYFQTLLVT